MSETGTRPDDGRDGAGHISPLPTADSQVQCLGKRERLTPPHTAGEDDFDQPAKRSRASEERLRALQEPENCDPVAYWAATATWPKGVWRRSRPVNFAMPVTPATPAKRRSESSHRADRLRRFVTNGIFMQTSALLSKSSKIFCDELLEGRHEILNCSGFPTERLVDVLASVQDLSEARIKREVMPWVVPPAELLSYHGVAGLHYIGDELDAEWTRCSQLGGPRPKPDYTAGLLWRAFGPGEMRKLENYASVDSPVHVTPKLCFPFLVCEVKSGDVGLNEADRQNMHSASIAVRAIIELHRAAFGEESAKTKELYGQVLAFSVSHNHNKVDLYGHYAVLNDEDRNAPRLEFYRHPIDCFSLTFTRGRTMYTSYHFIRSVYSRFAPQHLQRVLDAVAALPESEERAPTSYDPTQLTTSSGDP